KKKKEKQALFRQYLDRRTLKASLSFNALPNSPSLFLPIQPFYHLFIPSPPPSASTTTTISPPIQVEQGMEHVEGALKGCFRPDMAAKRTQHHAILDDLCAFNGQSGVSGDDFLVEDFLDFSKGGIEDGFFQAEDEPDHEEETKPCSLSVDKEQQAVNKDKDSDLCRSSFSAIDDFGSVPCSELSVPADDLEGLEWLSHFVDDSFSEYSLAEKLPENREENRSEPPEIPVPTKPFFTTPVQTKARSKRARTGGRVWSLGSRSLTESSSSNSSSSSTSSTSPLNNAWLIYTSPVQTAESLLGQLPPPAKKAEEKTGNRRRVPAAAAVQPLPRPENPPVASRSTRCQNTLQRLRGPIQIGSAVTRVPPRLQPDVLERGPLQQPPESVGNAAEEGGGRRRRVRSAGPKFLKTGLVRK
ncbi:hypothetical protein HYC85_002164, partial [Camellia sinensis]